MMRNFVTLLFLFATFLIVNGKPLLELLELLTLDLGDDELDGDSLYSNHQQQGM
jgi:hypothetical protein